MRLSWPPLASLSQNVTGVRYKLVFSESPDAVMDSVCAIKSGQSQVFTVYEDIDGDNAYDIELPRGHDVQFNVIAVVD